MADNGGSKQVESLQRMVSLQARVCYMNVDRTLATWTRTALSLIVFGVVLDRYGVLVLYDHPPHAGTWLAPNPASSVGGVALVVLGLFIVVAAAIRHEAYRKAWQRVYGRDETFGPWLAFPFALMVAIAGCTILAVLLLLVK